VLGHVIGNGPATLSSNVNPNPCPDAGGFEKVNVVSPVTLA
jgi:hypothetical protein